MAQIIQFRPKYSVGYKNLKQLFEVCESVDACNVYMESAEQLYTDGRITKCEFLTLRRIGRQKRTELAAPKQREPEKVTGSGVYSYTPEMGQQRPDCQLEASLAYYGKHYFVDSPVELKGRGITFIKQYEDRDLRPSGKYMVGWYEYCVTKKAFEKLKEKYSISMESCLD